MAAKDRKEERKELVTQMVPLLRQARILVTAPEELPDAPFLMTMHPAAALGAARCRL